MARKKYRGDPAGGDPFLEDFFRKIPERTARSFTDEQLLAIKMGFAARSGGVHGVDIRFSIPLIKRYVVLLIGKERRPAQRRRNDRQYHPVGTVANLMAIFSFLVVFCTPALIIGYGLKSFLGINLMEDGGGHAFIEDFRQQLILMIKGF